MARELGREVVDVPPDSTPPQFARTLERALYQKRATGAAGKLVVVDHIEGLTGLGGTAALWSQIVNHGTPCPLVVVADSMESPLVRTIFEKCKRVMQRVYMDPPSQRHAYQMLQAMPGATPVVEANSVALHCKGNLHRAAVDWEEFKGRGELPWTSRGGHGATASVPIYTVAGRSRFEAVARILGMGRRVPLNLDVMHVLADFSGIRGDVMHNLWMRPKRKADVMPASFDAVAEADLADGRMDFLSGYVGAEAVRRACIASVGCVHPPLSSFDVTAASVTYGKAIKASEGKFKYRETIGGHFLRLQP